MVECQGITSVLKLSEKRLECAGIGNKNAPISCSLHKFAPEDQMSKVCSSTVNIRKTSGKVILLEENVSSDKDSSRPISGLPCENNESILSPSPCIEFNVPSSISGYLNTSATISPRSLLLSSSSSKELAMTNNYTNNNDTSYEYCAPPTSQFYQMVLSPLCDIICRKLLPRWLLPDYISLLGLACCCAAVYVASLGDDAQYVPSHGKSGILYGVAGLLWMLYSILDNLDGKQARRLNVSSPGGEFLDHSVDSVVVTLCGFVWMKTIMPWNDVSGWCVIVISIAAQIPFYLGTWAHDILGHVLLGGSTTPGLNILTVDEFNFLFLPSLCFVKVIDPGVYEYTLSELSVSNAEWASQVTTGHCMLVVMVLFSLFQVSRVMVSLLNWKTLNHVLPLFVYLALVWIYQPPLLLLVGPFSLSCIEIMAQRLRVHNAARSRWCIWWPNVLFFLTLFYLYPSVLSPPFMNGEFFFSIAPTPGSTGESSVLRYMNSSNKGAESLMTCFFLSLLCFVTCGYKLAINTTATDVPVEKQNIKCKHL